jgi:Peptidase A4 family
MKRIMLGVAAAALAASGLLPAATASAATRPVIPGNHTQLAHIRPGAHPRGAVFSTNWGGYAATGNTFNSVSATYSVPSVNCRKTTNAFAYQWVGLDGYADSTVEQDGVAGYCVSGSPTYFAWSEMYPAAVRVQFYLNPGDAVRSSVKYNTSTHVFTLALTDVTSGQSFSQTATCASTCHRSSAEVITEGYPVQNLYGGTADYGVEGFENTLMTDTAGHTNGFTSTHWSNTEIIQQGSRIDTQPSALYGGKAFTNTWLAES